MNNLTQKLMLGGSTAALWAAMSVSAVHAQGGDIEQVVVSASRVTIAGYSQPTPVTVVGAAQLEKDAYANITDAVRNLPQVNAPQASFGNENGGASQGSEGENILNLRNLGVIRTLVLFDSQRVVAANITGGVDVGVIPSAVISRIDVVTGGASAAWGSDAVAGVVNFVLNKNFDGFKATIQGSDDYRNTNRGLMIQGAWGADIFGGRGHLVLAADGMMRPDATMGYRENWNRNTFFVSNPAYVAGNGQPQLILANDVGLANANTGGIINSSPAVTAANSPTGAAVAANALRGIQFVGNGVPQLVNYGNLTLGSISNGGSLTGADGEKPWGLISAPNNVYTAFAYGKYKVTDTIQASIQLNYGYFTGKDFAQSNLQTALVIKSDNAFIPASVRSTMQATGITSFTMGTVNGNNFNNYTQQGEGYFQETAGDIAPATEINHRQMMRGVFTLEGTIGDNWAWNTYYAHSTVRYWAHILGSAIVANLNNAQDAISVTTANRGNTGLPLGSIACRSTLTAGGVFTLNGVTADKGCIPLNVFGEGVASNAAIRYVTGGQGRDFEHMQTNEDVIEGSMQGTLPWELPAGKVAVAFGAGYRKEAGVNHATQLGLQAAFAVANFTNYPSSSYNVMEGFAEIDAPIIKNGSIVDSVDVSMAGRLTSYSTSGLVETWKLGATSQINQDIKVRTTWSVDIRAPSLTELFNPASINTGSIKDPKTGITNSGITNVLGNPNLVPEIARTISGGVVLTPHWIEGFSMSMDWYNINMTGVITTIASSFILNTCTANINDPLCTHLVFNGAVNPTTGVPALSGINNAPVNLASLRTSGLDFQANYTMDFMGGSLAWQAVANLVDEITQTQPGVPTNDYAGVMGANQPSITSGSPKWKGVLSADFTDGPYSYTIQGRWFGTGIMNNGANQGNLATAATANLQSINEVPFTAYLDLRASYKYNDNITLFGAVDNALNNPPPLLPQNSATVPPGVPAQSLTYDLLGRTMRLGLRLNY